MTTNLTIRWIIRADMPDILAIESASFPPETAWTEEDFLGCLRQRNCIGMVAEYGEHAVGYMVYKLHKSSIEMLSIAVAPSDRRKGVGREMVDKLKRKVQMQKREALMLLTGEHNTPAHLFFSACGLRAEGVERKCYDSDQDGYRFAWRLNWDRGVNRVKSLMGECDGDER